MGKDREAFRKRFLRWKNGEKVYDNGRPAAIQLVDKSDADFAKRLRSNWREEIWDWEKSGKSVTHKIGGFNNIVYPNVQTTKGGGLIDFTNPIWKGTVDPAERALSNGDYVPMKTEQDAIWFGPNYKDYYPGFKDGKKPYKDGLPAYKNGTDDMPDYQRFVEEMGPVLYGEIIRQGVDKPMVAYRNMMTQLGHESMYGTSKVAKTLNNYGGVGWNGKTYTTYKSKEDFARNYVQLMKTKYKNAIGADTLQNYAKGLKKLGYYEDSVENYSNSLTGMKSFHKAMYNHLTNNPTLYPNSQPVITTKNTDRGKVMKIDWGALPQWTPPAIEKPIPETQYPLSGSQAPESLSSWNAALSPSATPTIPSIQKLNNEQLKAVQGAFLLPEVTVWGNKRVSLLPKMPSLGDLLAINSPQQQVNRALSESLGLADLLEDDDMFGELFKFKNGKKPILPRFEDGTESTDPIFKENGNPDGAWQEQWLNGRQQQLLENYNINPKKFDKYGTATAEQQLNNLKSSKEYRGVKGVNKEYGYDFLLGDLGNNMGGYIGGMTIIGEGNPNNIIMYPSQTLPPDTNPNYIDPNTRTMNGVPVSPNMTDEDIIKWNSHLKSDPLDVRNLNMIHERTHALSSPLKNRDRIGSLPQDYKIDLINKKHGLKSTESNSTHAMSEEEYHMVPNEIYAGLMLQRYALGLTPDHVVTKEEIRLWKNEGKLNQFLKDKPDDVLLEYFNEVASNPNPLFDPTNVLLAFGPGDGRMLHAKNGKLPKYEDGSIPYEKDGVKYNINPNVIGAQQLNVTAPQVTITGRNLTKPYFSSYLFNPTTFQRELLDFIKKRAYQSITPVGYDLPKAAREFMSGQRDYNYLSDAPMREALSAKYFDQPGFKYAGGEGMVSDWITESPYQPSKGTATYGKTYRFNPEMFSYTPQEGKYESYLSDEKIRRYFRERASQGKDNVLFSDGASDLGPYTMGSGKDDKGHYISYYDDWDINFAEGESAPEIARKLRKLFPSGDMLMGSLGTKPFTMYDRRYLTEDEWKALGGYKNGKQPKLKYRHGKLPRHEDGLVPGLGKPKKLTPRDIKVSPGEPGLLTMGPMEKALIAWLGGRAVTGGLSMYNRARAFKLAKETYRQARLWNELTRDASRAWKIADADQTARNPFYSGSSEPLGWLYDTLLRPAINTYDKLNLSPIGIILP